MGMKVRFKGDERGIKWDERGIKPGIKCESTEEGIMGIKLGINWSSKGINQNQIEIHRD